MLNVLTHGWMVVAFCCVKVQASSVSPFTTATKAMELNIDGI